MSKPFVLINRKLVLVTLVLAFLFSVVYLFYSIHKRPVITVNFGENWESVVPHKETLVNWQETSHMGRLTEPVDWTKIKIRQPPPVEEMHDKWIVVTSIAAPTEDVKKLSKIDGWQLLVVGDTKTPDNWSLPNTIFLSVKQQLQLGYRTAEVMPFKNYARKTIGHLYAIQHGAKMIYETDDDTYPYDGKIKFSQQGTGDFLVYSTEKRTVNPYAHFGQATIWPRGYPLENIANLPQYTFIKCRNVKALIQQGVVDGDPDVDALFRLTRKDDGVQLDLKFDPVAPPILIPPGSYTPYNCQNTLHLYDSFWGLVLPPSGTLRVTDIWRSFFTQRLLQEINGYLGYFGPSAYQVRNAHNYLQDFIDEQELYYKSGRYLAYLEQWKPNNTDFFNRILMLAVDLVFQDIWKSIDAVVVEAWLEDLVSFGYKVPPMKKTTKPCPNILESPKKIQFKQQPSSYIGIGKEMINILQEIKKTSKIKI